MNPKFISLIEEVIKNNISDLHLGSNEPPYIRNKTGGIVPVAQYGVISDEEIREIAEKSYWTTICGTYNRCVI